MLRAVFAAMMFLPVVSLQAAGPADVPAVSSTYDPMELESDSVTLKVPALTWTAEEKKWLSVHDRIHLGVHKSYLPYEAISSNGTYEGIVADYIRFISRKTGMKLYPQGVVSWYNPIKLITDGQVDVIPMLGPTDERRKYLLFTRPFLKMKIALMACEGSNIESTDDLRGKTVAAILDYNHEEMLKQDYPGVKFVLVPTEEEAIRAIAEHKAEAVIGDLATLTYLRHKDPDCRLKLINVTPYEYEICFGIRRDWPELVSILNKTIAVMPVRYQHYLYRQWTSVRVVKQNDFRLLVGIAGGAAALLIVFGIGVFFWRRRIIREMRNRQQTEDDLSNHLDFLKALFDTIPGPVFCCTATGVILSCNRAFARLFSHGDSSTLSGTNLFEIMMPNNSDKVERLRDQLKTVPSSAGAVLFDLELDDNDGQRREYSFYVGTFRKGMQNNARIGVMLDISEKKRIQQELEKAKNAAEAATEAKGNFVANMSHELRTPLNALIGIGHLMLQTELDDKQVNYLQKIDTASRHLLGVINDILDFSKIEAGKMTLEEIDFNLPSICQEVNDMFTARAKEKNLALEFRLDDKIPAGLRGDPLRLKQVLINLISNSVKFTNQGSIVVAIEAGRKRGRKVKLKFSIRDSGIGMSQEQLDSLFEPFSQADNSMTRKFGGTGLGLVITRSLIEMMEGHMEVQSTPNVGSNFEFDIELEFGNVEQEGGNATPSPVITINHMTMKEKNLEKLEKIKGAKVLLVEDNTINRQVAMEMLAQVGIVVDSAENGKEAVDIITGDHAASYDAIFMDVQMPIMDGYKATETIRAAGINTPIIALTAHVMPAAIKRCLQSGMNDHLNKPLNPELLYVSLLKWVKPGQRETIEENRKAVYHPPVEKPKLCDMPGLNLTRALEPLSGDTVLMAQLLNSFRKDFGTEGVNITHAFDGGDWNYLKHTFHKIKGSASYIGAEDLRTISSRLEEKIFNDETVTLDEVEALIRLLNQVNDSIAMLVGKPTVAH